ncbi:MAG: hypothetical protein AB9888_12660 [Bacteroidales bacterium]
MSPIQKKCVICEHWIFFLLGYLALWVVFLVFYVSFPIGFGKGTRSLPATNEPARVSPTGEMATPSMAVPTMAKPPFITPTLMSTPTVVGEIGKVAGYQNTEAKYALNYPVSMKGMETGSSVIFSQKDLKIEVNVRPAGSDSLLSIPTKEGPLDIPHQFSESEIDGEPALREDLLGEKGETIGRIYHVFHAGRRYGIGLISNPNEPLPSSFNEMLLEFEKMVSSFQFSE